jgi:hypothetical protein
VRIRQLALVARDLEPAVADLCAVLGLEVAFRDPGVGEFGLHNALMPIGDAFLEVVSPLREGTTAGRFLERRGGDGGYMVIVQTHDLASRRRRIEQLGVRIVWEIALPDIAAIHLHPRDLGGAIVSLDQAEPPRSWRWAGPGWERSVRRERCTAIEGVLLEGRDPAGMAARWSRVLERPARELEGGVHEIALDAGAIRFGPAGARGEGFAAFDVLCVDRGAILAAARARGLPVGEDSVEVCGTRIRLR